MKLRPRDSRFPINDKGKEPMREDEEDSDDEEINALPSFESDYDSDSDKGEENEGQVPDLNLDPKPALVENNSEEVDQDQDQDQEELLDIDIDMEQDIEDLIEEEEFLEVEVENSKKRKRKSKKDKPTLLWQVWQEENERWIQENLDKNLENENHNEVIPETVETPSDMIMPLLRYQKEWLAWALKQEESDSRGGILADEMGMGKTVQAIALVCAKRELKNAISGTILPSCGACPSTSTELPSIKATLVICPLVAVLQWQKEIERFTKKGSNKVLVYHGANRAKKFNKFSDYDFVITTYSTIEAEYRKNVMPPKKKCEWCAKPLYEDKMAVHLKYFCGPNATRTISQAKQRKRKAVKVKTGVKSSKQEVTKKRRPRKSKKSAKDNTETENGETNENEGDIEEDLPIKQQSNLHAVKWERIILDEAHYIKDRRSNTTKAVLALISNYKWALSGTPLQNRVGELYSLVRFLQIVPYSYYFCKDCDCRVLDYGVTDCPSCPHKCVRHFCWWNKYIASPIQAHWNNSIGKGAMLLLKEKLLKSIVLRRTKKGRAADLALPPRIVTLRRDSFDITEEDYYTSLYNETQAEFDTYVNEGTLMNNYAHIFDLLTRLRQAVDHPYLVVYSNVAIAKAAARMTSTEPQQICGICDDVVEDVVVTSCGHPFCKTCLMEFCASGEQVSCPTCSKPLTVDFSGEQSNVNAKTSVKGYRASSILNRIQLDNFQSSTKIEALREEIRLMSERDGAAKGIVFSQFTSFLDLIHYSLQKSGIKCVSLVGSMTMNARDVAIKKFIEDSECKVFLMSLKAGGVALNLTVASHVFLMDPWWNPAVERQAQDRIHRIGQYKPIKTVRFVIENTVEERILKLQQKKELVFEGTVGGSVEALGKLTEADLKFLFC